MMAIITGVIPMVPNIWDLYLCGFLFGFGSSVYVSGAVVWGMHIVGNKGRTLLQLLDFSFSIGSIICTVILKPHLVGDLHTSPINQTSSIIMSDIDLQDQVSDPNEIDRRSNLMFPVLAIGLCILPGILFNL